MNKSLWLNYFLKHENSQAVFESFFSFAFLDMNIDLIS